MLWRHLYGWCGSETGKGGRELGYMRRRWALESSAASMLAPSTAEDGVTCASPHLADPPAFHHGSQLALSSSPWHACGTLAGIMGLTPAQVMWPRHGITRAASCCRPLSSSFYRAAPTRMLVRPDLCPALVRPGALLSLSPLASSCVSRDDAARRPGQVHHHGGGYRRRRPAPST
jgi:hypothetical protein